jgi:hypothetical protein
VCVGAASTVLIPLYASIDTDGIGRSAGIFLDLIGRLFKPDLYMVHISIASLAVYSFIVLILILRRYGNDMPREIPFIALFVVSFAFESMRLIIPLQQVINIPSFYLVMASRILLFSRNFGLFSLVTASMYAAGLKLQKQRNLYYIITVISFVIALGTPIDTFSLTSNFEPSSGYSSIFRMLNAGILFITVTDFLIAAYVQKSKNHIFMGVGAFLAIAGRNILLTSDTWAGLPGIALLGAGTWFICRCIGYSEAVTS